MAPTLVKVFLGLAAVLSASSAVSAESHTITFDNQCGKGTPQLLVGGQVVSSGDPYTSSSAISGAIAYLQTGECNTNGEGCTLLEMTLNNPTCIGCGSSSDISLIPPHAFNVEASISYYGACNGQGTTCSSADCSEAFHNPNDNQVQVQCESDNSNLLITFCGNAMTNALVVGGGNSSASAAPKASSSASHVASSSAAPTSATPVSASPVSISVATEPASKATQTLVAVSSSSAAPSATPSVNRGTCKNKKRMERRRAEQPQPADEARALYDLHDRRRRVQARAHEQRSH